MPPEPSIRLPPGAVVEVFSEPSPRLFQSRAGSLTALLRLALLGGAELTLPTVLHLVLDLCGEVVPCARKLVLFHGRGIAPRLQICRDLQPPPLDENLLNAWIECAGKPVLALPGLDAAMDRYLGALHCRGAVGTPLFLDHELAGSLQLYSNTRPYAVEDAQLLWLLSLLAENQLTRLRTVQELARVAYTDFLTGLRTRGYFEQALDHEVRRALRLSAACGLLLLDLDGFKRVNDRFGHHAGDAVLRQLAAVLTRYMRDVDSVARYGGDEFSIILPDTDAAGARFVAQRLRDVVAQTAFVLPDVGHPLRLDVSVGVAICPEDERHPRDLLRRADLALYQAKRAAPRRPLLPGDLRRAG